MAALEASLAAARKAKDDKGADNGSDEGKAKAARHQASA